MSEANPIAEGRTAEIYPAESDRVLKLYKPGFARETPERERRASMWAASCGLPVPRPDDVVEVDGRWGIPFGRVEGQNGMTRLLTGVVPVEDEARQLAEMQWRVLACDGGPMPDRRELLRSRIEGLEELSDAEKSAAGSILDDLPAGHRLLHGDMHPGNVIWSPDGPVVVDWVDASRGVPAADFARTTVLMRAWDGAPDRNDPPSRFIATYLAAFRELSADSLDRLDDWLTVTAAARVAEGAASGDAELREFVHRRLA